MRPKAQNEMAGLWPHAAMGPVERMVRHLAGRLGCATGSLSAGLG